MKSSFSRNYFLVLLVLVLLAPSISCAPTSSSPAKFSYKMPQTVDSSARYLFYMHCLIVSNQGPRGYHPNHPEWGPHDYYGILSAFEQEGFKVISEERPKSTIPPDYAQKVAGNVRTLLTAGVPPQNITVSGYSIGGTMSLLVSDILKNTKINYVILSGCCKDNPVYAQKYRRLVLPIVPSLHGRFLSVYDKNDDECGTCEPEFAAAPPDTAETKEIKLTKGMGHGQFWVVRKEWFEPVVEWIKEAGP